MDLETPRDIICRIIQRAREGEAEVPAADAENEDAPIDSDDDLDMIEEEMNSVSADELRAAIDDLADDQQAELLALALVGRGTYDPSEWTDALEEANDGDAEPVLEQLLDMPMLGDYLDAGLAAFEMSCAGVGQID
jgi:DNA-directed RNA polymerase specialized sigma24 family protein